MWGCTLVSANTHFIALDFRVCGVILRKTLGFDKLSKDSQVNVRWRIQRISRITGSLWHGTWRKRPGSRPKCSDTSSLLSQPSDLPMPWNLDPKNSQLIVEPRSQVPPLRRNVGTIVKVHQDAGLVSNLGQSWKLASFRDPVLSCDCMCHQRMVDWSYALPVVFRTAKTVDDNQAPWKLITQLLKWILKPARCDKCQSLESPLEVSLCPTPGANPPKRSIALSIWTLEDCWFEIPSSSLADDSHAHQLGDSKVPVPQHRPLLLLERLKYDERMMTHLELFSAKVEEQL